jgi:hypothetical protein
MTKWIDGNPYEMAAVTVIIAIYICAKLSLRKEEKERKRNEKTD